VALHSLLFCASIQARKLSNPISHEGVMDFSGEAWSWSFPSLVLTHLHFFSRFSCLEFENPNFLVPFIACSLALRFKPKTRKSDITRGSYELFLVKPGPWSVPSPSRTQLDFFSRFSPTEFQNPNFLVSLHSFLYWDSIQARKLENPIWHEGAMSVSW
jgi:hypothetical protein